MTVPQRWAQTPSVVADEARAAEVMKVAAQTPPRAVEVREWEDVLLRAGRRGRAWPVLALVATAMLIAVASGLGWQRYTAPRLSASREAKVSVTEAGVVISWGSLDVTTKRPLQVSTPHLTSLIVSGRVAAQVDAYTTRIEVYEGVASLRTDGEQVDLHAGQSRQWPAVPAMPESLKAAAPLAGACDARPEAERLDCLVTASHGTGLAAQVALYERAAQPGLEPHAAQAIWRESLRRFPAGVLHPEVRLRLLRSLLEERAFDAAIREASAFEQTCPSDPRVNEVQALRQMLEREQPSKHPLH